MIVVPVDVRLASTRRQFTTPGEDVTFWMNEVEVTLHELPPEASL